MLWLSLAAFCFASTPESPGKNPGDVLGLELVKAAYSGHNDVLKLILARPTAIIPTLEEEKSFQTTRFLALKQTIKFDYKNEKLSVTTEACQNWESVALAAAFQVGNKEAVENLLSTSRADFDMEKALQAACSRGFTDILHFLTNFPSFDMNLHKRILVSGMEAALKGAHEETVKVLLNLGIVPAHIPIENPMLISLDLFRLVLNSGFQLKKVDELTIHEVASAGLTEYMRVLVDMGADPVSQLDGLTEAIWKGHVETLEVMMSSALFPENLRKLILAAFAGDEKSYLGVVKSSAVNPEFKRITALCACLKNQHIFIHSLLSDMQNTNFKQKCVSDVFSLITKMHKKESLERMCELGAFSEYPEGIILQDVSREDQSILDDGIVDLSPFVVYVHVAAILRKTDYLTAIFTRFQKDFTRNFSIRHHIENIISKTLFFGDAEVAGVMESFFEGQGPEIAVSVALPAVESPIDLTDVQNGLCKLVQNAAQRIIWDDYSDPAHTHALHFEARLDLAKAIRVASMLGYAGLAEMLGEEEHQLILVKFLREQGLSPDLVEARFTHI